jgi:hypothetical protein
MRRQQITMGAKIRPRYWYLQTCTNWPRGPVGEESLYLVSNWDLEIARGAIYQYRRMATGREEVKISGRIDSSDPKSKMRAA